MLSLALPLAPDPTSPTDGGAVCLAFANSVWWRRSDEPNDQLRDFPAVIDQLADRLDPAAATELRDAADADERAAGRALARALAFRETVHGVFASIASGNPPAEVDLADLDAWVSRAAGRLHLVPDLDGYALRVVPADEAELFDLPLYEVALSAAALLTSDQLGRVRACPGPTCGWLFVDTTRNGSRRWCDPTQCGNRERVRAHYHRTHAAR